MPAVFLAPGNTLAIHRFADVLDVPARVRGLASVGLAFFRPGRKPRPGAGPAVAALVLAFPPGVYLAFMATRELFFARFALPLLPFGCLLVAYGVAQLAAQAQLVATFSPVDGERQAPPFNPDDIGLPYWTVTRYDRPGPTINAYRLSPAACPPGAAGQGSAEAPPFLPWPPSGS